MCDVRWDASSGQHFRLHSVEAFTFTDAQLDLHSVVAVMLEEEAVVDDKLGIGSRAIENVDLQEEQKNCKYQRNNLVMYCLHLQGHTELKSESSTIWMISVLWS